MGLILVPPSSIDSICGKIAVSEGVSCREKAEKAETKRKWKNLLTSEKSDIPASDLQLPLWESGNRVISDTASWSSGDLPRSPAKHAKVETNLNPSKGSGEFLVFVNCKGILWTPRADVVEK